LREHARNCRIATRISSSLSVKSSHLDVSTRAAHDHLLASDEVSSVNLITDKVTGELRGFGFVEMPTQSEAEAAIKGLNGTAIAGRAIQVTIARQPRR
jgi:RNA recognition motif-containing protein